MRPAGARNISKKCRGIRLWDAAPNPGRRGGKRLPGGLPSEAQCDPQVDRDD